MKRTNRTLLPIRRLVAALTTTIVATAMLLTASPPAQAGPSWPSDMDCGGVYVFHTGSGMMLDFDQSDDPWHGRVIQMPWNDWDDEKWTMCRSRPVFGDPVFEYEYTFVTRWAGGPWCMGVTGGLPGEGAILKVEDCNNLPHQRFKLFFSVGPMVYPRPFVMQVQHTKMFVGMSDFTSVGAVAKQYRYQADMFWLEQV
ncbi:RICIN domain-containing protein [Embleya sp. NPDC059237]|uniref:RICIN domain-containing protein n=1 Tax=Embleya sp. NPDC059237 TaxID=3346784 RepID=UPI0036795931